MMLYCAFISPAFILSIILFLPSWALAGSGDLFPFRFIQIFHTTHCLDVTSRRYSTVAS